MAPRDNNAEPVSCPAVVDAIDTHATKVFADLAKCCEAVILFDECDELFRKRPRQQTGEGLSMAALITGAMLPRLQDLHDRGKIIFVLATNRIDAIDPAITRAGRFDHLVARPPRTSSTYRIIPQECPTFSDGGIQALALATDRFTRAELDRAAGEIRGLPDVDECLTTIQKRFPSDELTISIEEMEEFRRAR